MNIINYSAQSALSGTTPVDVTLLTGSTNNTIARSLEISNTYDGEVFVWIKRFDDSSNEYATMKLMLPKFDYVILWADAQVCIPVGHMIKVAATQEGVSFVANCVEM